MDKTLIQKRSSTNDEIAHDDKRLKLDEDKNEMSSFDFTEKTWKEDFVLIAENTKLYVTKAILAHASPVFDRMFQANFKEKYVTELELPEKKVEDVQSFLRCIYPFSADVNPENVYAVLPLAEEYQVSKLKSKCETCMLGIISKTISSDELYNVIGQAILYNMPYLLERCTELASEMSTESFYNAEKRMTIPTEVKYNVLDKMVSKMVPKQFLEAMKNYYESGLREEEKLCVRDYAKWDGKSMEFFATLNEWNICHVNLLGIGISVQCSLKITTTNYSTFQDSSLTMKIDKRGEQKYIIRVCGTVVIKPVMTQYEVIKEQFQFDFSGSTERKKDWAFLSPTDKSRTLQRYTYGGKVKVALHVLAEKR